MRPSSVTIDLIESGYGEKVVLNNQNYTISASQCSEMPKNQTATTCQWKNDIQNSTTQFPHRSGSRPRPPVRRLAAVPDFNTDQFNMSLRVTTNASGKTTILVMLGWGHTCFLSTGETWVSGVWDIPRQDGCRQTWCWCRTVTARMIITKEPPSHVADAYPD